MAKELDEAWIEAAIAGHHRVERLQAAVEAWVEAAEVTVHSPDELVEVRVCPDGSIRRVSLGPVEGRSSAELSKSIEAVVGAAADAADWARRTLYAEAARAQGPF
ncbi:MAG TPA: YbaB/EbfC family DNA-binding protein [Natronosporangium sp.]